MSIYVIFDDAGRVTTAFPSPQDQDIWPGITEIEEDDPRYLAFFNSMKQSPGAEALQIRDSLLRTAAIRIDPLQDAVDIGQSTAEEETLLLSWKMYRVALNRLPDQPGFPIDIDWPASPA